MKKYFSNNSDQKDTLTKEEISERLKTALTASDYPAAASAVQSFMQKKADLIERINSLKIKLEGLNKELPVIEGRLTDPGSDIEELSKGHADVTARAFSASGLIAGLEKQLPVIDAEIRDRRKAMQQAAAAVINSFRQKVEADFLHPLISRADTLAADYKAVMEQSFNTLLTDLNIAEKLDLEHYHAAYYLRRPPLPGLN
jgi:hypothetical protein